MLSGDYYNWKAIRYQPKVTLYPDALLAQLPPAATLLDIGCHDGVASCYVARTRPDLVVHGIDINPHAVAAARHRARREGLTNVHFQSADVLSMDTTRRIDAVMTIRLLTCFPEIESWRALLRAIELSLEPGGWWYAVDYRFDQNSRVYADRYAAGERAGWRRGNFRATTASGQAFIAHHHSEEEIALLGRIFDVRSVRRFEGRSMNGNPAAMFELLARRRESA